MKSLVQPAATAAVLQQAPRAACGGLSNGDAPPVRAGPGSELIIIGADRMRSLWPVKARALQPGGRLRGAAQVVLCKIPSPYGSFRLLERRALTPAGPDMNTNHFRSVRARRARGRAWPALKGRTIQICPARLTGNKRAPDLRRRAFGRCNSDRS